MSKDSRKYIFSLDILQRLDFTICHCLHLVRETLECCVSCPRTQSAVIPASHKTAEGCQGQLAAGENTKTHDL